jgi:hypothetical protein
MHGIMDGVQKNPLSQRKNSTSSLRDHWARFGFRTASAPEASSLSFVEALFSQLVETRCFNRPLTYLAVFLTLDDSNWTYARCAAM